MLAQEHTLPPPLAKIGATPVFLREPRRASTLTASSTRRLLLWAGSAVGVTALTAAEASALLRLALAHLHRVEG
jgi:uncharacterized membrane protein